MSDPSTDNNFFDKVKGILKDREQHYGKTLECHQTISRYWSTYLGKAITATDVAMMLALFKIARQGINHKPDNLIDAAAYISFAHDFNEPTYSRLPYDVVTLYPFVVHGFITYVCDGCDKEFPEGQTVLTDNKGHHYCNMDCHAKRKPDSK